MSEIESTIDFNENKIIAQFLGEFCVIFPTYVDCDIELVHSGYRRNAYKLTSINNDSCILKLHKETGDFFIGSNDVLMQSFLINSGIDFIPKILFSNNSHDTYIETCAGEEHMSFNDLDNSGIDSVAKQLYQVHSLKADDYINFAKNNGFGEIKINTPKDDLKTYGYERFKIAKEKCHDKYVLDWLGTKLEQSTELIDKIIKIQSHPHPQWGDIGGNLRHTGKKIYFTDFEHSSIGYDSELSYIIIHSHMYNDKFKKLVSCYVKHSGRSESDLYKEMKIKEIITRTNDVVWAAMQWSFARNDEDKIKYQELTYKRINLAENISS